MEEGLENFTGMHKNKSKPVTWCRGLVTVHRGVVCFVKLHSVPHERLRECHNVQPICRNLENAIRRFEYFPGFIDAVAKWKRDLKFVNDYVKELNNNHDNP